MRVTVIGCGDAFGSGGRAQSATLVETQATTILLDCGATTMPALNLRGIDPLRLDAVVLTHLHGDHFGGLPFLLLDLQWTRGRTRPLRIIGPPGTQRRLHEAMAVFFAGLETGTPWTYQWAVEEIAPGGTLLISDATVSVVEVLHPCGDPPLAVRIEAGGRVFAHSGDTEWVDVLAEVAEGADLMFLECMGFEQPAPGHLDYATLATKRPLLRAKQLVLTHLGPRMLANLHHVDRALFDIAEDGRVFTV